MKRLLLIAFLIIGGAFVSAQSFNIQILNVESQYLQGDTANAYVSVQLADQDLNFEKAVIFLNVVEIDKAKRYPQAAHKIFATADIDHDIFKKVYSKQDLINGVSANVSYSFKKNAKAAKYALVIQIFEGSNTNPHRLAGKKRIGFKAHHFDVLTR